jgi:hypothetical protein
MSHNLPYLTSQKRVKGCLDKIIEASTPEKFNISFINDKLDMKGGTAASLPPLLKRIGFVATDGSPTEWYKEFRNPTLSGQVAFKALKHAYSDIFEVNENAHKKGDGELKGIVAQVTGLDHDNPIINHIVGTFKTIKSYASFEEPSSVSVIEYEEERPDEKIHNGGSNNPPSHENKVGLNIGYNINLNLPATSEIAVFDAIFKSLKEHLLKES